MTEREKEIAKRVKRNQQRVEREWRAACKADKTWMPRFQQYELETLSDMPHLMEHEFCGMIDLFEEDITNAAAVSQQMELGI